MSGVGTRRVLQYFGPIVSLEFCGSKSQEKNRKQEIINRANNVDDSCDNF